MYNQIFVDFCFSAQLLFILVVLTACLNNIVESVFIKENRSDFVFWIHFNDAHVLREVEEEGVCGGKTSKNKDIKNNNHFWKLNTQKQTNKFKDCSF